MTGSGTHQRRLRRIIAVLALSELAYRLFVRAPLRRNLGLQTRHA